MATNVRAPRGRLARLLAAASLAVAGACSDAGPAGEPGWTSLATSGPGLDASAALPPMAVGGRDVHLVEDGSGTLWLESVLRPNDWEWDPKTFGGVWKALVFLRTRGQPTDGSHGERVLIGGHELVLMKRAELQESGDLPSGHFHVARNKFDEKLQPGLLLLGLEDGEQPPAEVLVRAYATPEIEDGTVRVNGRRFSGTALPVWPGQTVERRLDVPAGRALRFATCIEPALALPAEQGGPVTFRVELDGETIFEHVAQDSLRDDLVWHTVELPPRGAKGASLVFRVDGAFAHTGFFAPTLGPATPGTFGDRPWGATRPDIVVFLADTFRADNLGAYGSEAGLTPYLDGLAEESLFFERAWSVATFTMPAHASMFSGLYARQSGATSTISALPDDVKTIAEWLGEHGYRTGAVTDSVVVSQKNNLDQGFEFFDEHHGTLEETIERAHAFLDADDGRPTFLFVQSYRTHTPYAVSRETVKRHGRALGIELSFNKASKELRNLGRKLGLSEVDDLRRSTKEFYKTLYETPGADPKDVAAYERLVAQMRALYLGTVADLDRGFAVFHEGLRERGLLDVGYFLFTSDHGEAFNEHGKVFHGGKVWNELTRIPLMITGPGVETRVERRQASLVDFAPTIAAMARVRSAEGWVGSSLLDLQRDRVVFAFENQKHRNSTLHVIEDGRKVMAYEDEERLAAGEIFAAFDLGADPHEEEDVLGEATWPAELLERTRAAAAALLVPLYGEQAGYVDDERDAALEALGYGGDDG